jgi:hypothetical protein
MVDRILRDLWWARPLPMPAGEDARSLIQGQGLEAFCELLEEADRRAQGFRAMQRGRPLAEFLRVVRGGRDA